MQFNITGPDSVTITCSTEEAIKMIALFRMAARMQGALAKAVKILAENEEHAKRERGE